MSEEEVAKVAEALAKKLKNGNGNGNGNSNAILKWISIPVIVGWIVASVWWAATTSSDVRHQTEMLKLYDQRVGMIEARVIVLERDSTKLLTKTTTKGE